MLLTTTLQNLNLPALLVAGIIHNGDRSGLVHAEALRHGLGGAYRRETDIRAQTSYCR